MGDYEIGKITPPVKVSQLFDTYFFSFDIATSNQSGLRFENCPQRPDNGHRVFPSDPAARPPLLKINVAKRLKVRQPLQRLLKHLDLRVQARHLLKACFAAHLLDLIFEQLLGFSQLLGVHRIAILRH